MEEVTWFFEDEDGKCVASVQLGIDDMRYAVQYLKNDVENGRYILVDKKEFLLYKRCNYPPEEETPVFS